MSLDDFTPFAEVHASLPRHRKVYALARVLSQKRTTVVGMLIFLWLWALDDVNVSGIIDNDALAIADIMCWDGDPNLLFNALICPEINLLDVLANGKLKIHDWDNFTGYLQEKRIKRREDNRLAQQRHRHNIANSQLPMLKENENEHISASINDSQHDVSMTSALSQHTTEPKQNRIEPNNIYNIFTVWNEQKIIVHKNLSDDIKRAINTSLKDNSIEEISQGIKNYSEIIKDDRYFFHYKWTLKEFLKRGLAKFLDLEIAKENYLRNGKVADGQKQRPVQARKPVIGFDAQTGEKVSS